MPQHYLTKEGLEKLKKDLEHLKTVARKEVVERIAAARDLGDLKENSEYAEAKDDQAMLEGKIIEFETVLREAQVIDEDRGSANVTIGSTVTVSFDDKDYTYTIVGPEEADPQQSKISHESPLGKAFLGKKKGDKALVRAPRGEFTYTIKEIA